MLLNHPKTIPCLSLWKIVFPKLVPGAKEVGVESWKQSRQHRPFSSCLSKEVFLRNVDAEN